MNLYSRARKHFDMNRIKELTQDKELKVEKEFDKFKKKNMKEINQRFKEETQAN